MHERNAPAQTGISAVAPQTLTGLSLIRRCYAEATRTEFLPPKGFWTVSLALGSGSHWPSTTNMYSWRPEMPVNSPTHLPLPASLSGVLAGFQPLNEPATQTDLAPGFSNWSGTRFTPGDSGLTGTGLAGSDLITGAGTGSALSWIGLAASVLTGAGLGGSGLTTAALTGSGRTGAGLSSSACDGAALTGSALNAGCFTGSARAPLVFGVLFFSFFVVFIIVCIEPRCCKHGSIGL